MLFKGNDLATSVTLSRGVKAFPYDVLLLVLSGLMAEVPPCFVRRFAVAVFVCIWYLLTPIP